MFGKLRPYTAAIFTGPARLLLTLKVHPNAVTLVGTLGVVFGAVWFFPQGGKALFWGVMVVTFFVFTDMLDGTMARLGEKGSRFGAFLDSTLDRVADAAIFGSLIWAFMDTSRVTALAALVCLAVGSFVPYARARAEGLGIDARIGIAERTDRLVVGLTATGLVGLGLPLGVLTWTLWALSLAAAITVAQRGWVVWKASQAELREREAQRGVEAEPA